jgi:hypothetical protein
MGNKTTFDFLRDSAIVTTGAAVLLFVWGSSFQAFTASAEGFPLVFLPELSTQEHMLNGGLVALFVLFPFALIVLIIDRLSGQRLLAYPRASYRRGAADAFLWSAVAFAVSIALLSPVARLVTHVNNPYRLKVRSIRLATPGSSKGFDNLYFVTRRGGNYVFVDRPQTGDPVVHILHADEMRELVLGSDSR